MVKTTTFVKRRAGLDRQEFLAYWRGEHVPLLQQLPGLPRQCSNLAIVIPGKEPRFDLVAEAWWNDLASLLAAADSPAGKAVAESLERIAEPGQLLRVIGAERVIVPPPSGSGFVKTFSLLHRRSDLSFEQFDRHWHEEHPKVVTRLAGLRGYVQCPVVHVPGQTPPVDGVPIAWFDDLDANRAAVHSPAYEAVRADERHFLDQARLIGLATVVDE